MRVRTMNPLLEPFTRPVPPHPGPLPWGEGATLGRLTAQLAARRVQGFTAGTFSRNSLPQGEGDNDVRRVDVSQPRQPRCVHVEGRLFSSASIFSSNRGSSTGLVS